MEASDIEALAGTTPPPPAAGAGLPASPLRCWEYLAGGKGVLDACEKCIVYRSQAALCFRLLDAGPHIGHSRTFCQSSCEECVYYRRVQGLPMPVLVITADSKLIHELECAPAGKLVLRFARSGYEASAVVQQFHPGFVVVDCDSVADGGDALVRCLSDDRRVPGLRVILAARPGSRRRKTAAGADRPVAGVLSKPFGARLLESVIEAIPVPTNPDAGSESPGRNMAPTGLGP